MLYFHHIAVAAGGENKQFSFTGQPSVEQVGVASGEYLVSHHRSKKIGIIFRQSENWEPGRTAGKRCSTPTHVNVVADLPVQKDAVGVLGADRRLQRSGAEVGVGLGERAGRRRVHEAGPLAELQPDVRGVPLPDHARRARQQRLHQVQASKASPRGRPTSRAAYGGAFVEHDYDAEIRAFEATHGQVPPGVKPNDISVPGVAGHEGARRHVHQVRGGLHAQQLAGLFLGGMKLTVDRCARSTSAAGTDHIGGYSFLGRRP